jgi:hypothetical protein
MGASLDKVISKQNSICLSSFSMSVQFLSAPSCSCSIPLKGDYAWRIPIVCTKFLRNLNKLQLAIGQFALEQLSIDFGGALT